MMKSLLGGSSKILIDADKSNPMLYLPLDQMLKNAPRKSSGGDPDYVTNPKPPSSSSSGRDSSADENNARTRDRRRPCSTARSSTLDTYQDRKRDDEGKSDSVRVDLGVRRHQQKIDNTYKHKE